MTEKEEHNVSAYAPPMSTTKGSRKKYAGVIADIPQPHFQWDKRKNGESVEDVVCMTQVIMQQHVREHNNSSKTVSSNDQGVGREGVDVEIQQ
jgi:hypothetical protein